MREPRLEDLKRAEIVGWLRQEYPFAILSSRQIAFMV
jgi:hypothetical protein